MTTKELAKKNYARGLWTKDMLKALVKKSGASFSAEDYLEITGESCAT